MERVRAPNEEQHIPVIRTIDEIFEEDRLVKDKYVNIRSVDENVVVSGVDADKYRSLELVLI